MPTARDEKELVLRLRVELLAQYLVAADNQKRAAALALASTVIRDAKELFGRADAKLIPLLRMAGNIYLRYNEPARAIGVLTEALGIANIVYGTDDPAIRFVVADLGRAYGARGNAARSAELAKRFEYLDKLAPASIQGISVLAAAPPPVGEKPFQLVPVFFQTTRKKVGGNDPVAFFGTERADASTFGVSYVSVPRYREIGSIPHASLVRLDFSTDPNRHVVVKGLSIYQDAPGFLKAIKDRLSNSERREALIYIHGFNQTFQDAVEVAATLAVDLEIDGSAVAFAWPSKGSVFPYAADMDETMALTNKRALKDLLLAMSSAVDAGSVYVIAHSMGNRLLLEALQLLSAPALAPPFANIVFASPDVESNDFEKIVSEVRNQARSMTLYTAGSDIPLGLSETIRTGFFGARKLRRAGDSNGGVKSQTYLEVVDATKAQADWMGHSNFAQLAKDDLRALLWLQTPARKRCVLLMQQPGWRYDPPADCPSEAFGMASLFYRRLKDLDKAAQQLGSRDEVTSRQAAEILKAMLGHN